MKIALIQLECGSDIEMNVERGLKAAREAADNGAAIISFPELSFQPFYPRNPAEGNVLDLALPVPGPITESFSDLASETATVIILNIFERDGDKTYDTTAVIDNSGEIAGRTRMIHITDYSGFHEKGYYLPGNLGPGVFETARGRIGIAICYDRHYPEYMRALSLMGAEIVFVPQAGVSGEWPPGLYEAEMRVASFQNGYYSALCNRVGMEGDLNFSGESFVSSPAGEVLARAAEGSEDILYCKVDLGALNDYHAHQLFLRDRRPELYRKWFGERER
ncbi:MAG: carbon-nitrogen hydrolase family protein, partial [Candidatus Latescibacteria bacterium]|nr:carbon-nitrogen hydrolase family protein [bacterium]MBD3425295.1 carbon-nitrogen hydrolase family protein [Candidatus Latescibacterota bacterium]